MRLPSLLSSIGLLRKGQNFVPEISGVAASLVVALAATALPVLGDESCVATAADASNGEEVCAQRDDDADDENIDDAIDAEEEWSEDPIWWDYSIDQLFEDYFDCGSIIYGYVDQGETDHDEGANVSSSDGDEAGGSKDGQDHDGETDDFQDNHESGDSDDEDDDDSGDDNESKDPDDDDDDAYDSGDNHEHYVETDDLQDNQESKEEESNLDHDNPVSDLQLGKLRHQWAVMREKYVKEVNLIPIEIEYLEENDSLSGDEEDSSNSEITKATKVSNRGVSAMVVPSHVGDAGPVKGRGVYATEPIPKGTLVVNLDNGSTGIFKEGHSWREFAVTLPREAACNFIEWSWVQAVPPENETDDDIRNGLTIFLSFDESNLMNSGDWDGIEANVRCVNLPDREGGELGPCRFHYYAARDIAAGEELLIDYGEFENIDQSGWTDIGL